MGAAIAGSLLADGWKVAVAYRTSKAEAKATGAEAYQCDVSDPAAAAALVRKVGRVDALINAAGPYHRVSLMEETVEGWHEMFDNNLHPVFYLSRAVFDGMKDRGWGRIVNFSVANADQLKGQTHVTGYNIAKVGVLLLTRSLARLGAPYGITANAISPGFIEPAEAIGDIPAGYVGVPGDVVGVVRFLLSDSARYVNGTNIHVSGAWGV